MAFRWILSNNPELDLSRHIDNVGNTPLHLFRGCPRLGFYGCNLRCNKFLDLLLHHGGSLKTKNGSDETPIDCALIMYASCEIGCSSVTFYDKVALLGYEVRDEKVKNFLSKYQHDDNFENARKDYEEELSRLKIIRICRYPKVSLYDLLVFELNKASRFSSNEKLMSLFQKCGGNLENTFPHYGKMLNVKIKRASKRQILIDSATDKLELILAYRLPEVRAEMIFESFSMEELIEFNGYNWDFLKLL